MNFLNLIWQFDPQKVSLLTLAAPSKNALKIMRKFFPKKN
jgi:hypothetical protein